MVCHEQLRSIKSPIVSRASILIGYRGENQNMTKTLVHCVLVTGEIAKGWYSGIQSPSTGSFHIEDVRTEDGQFAEYAWATKIAE